jgi:ATP-dependent Lhr-like helicase
VLDRMVGVGRLVRGELRPAALATGHGEGTEYCDAEVLRRLRRGSLARLRSEVEPVEQQALGRFLPAWQGVQASPGGRRGRMRRAPGVDDVLGVVEQLAGAPLPASALESLVLPARLPGYTPALLDELTAAGEVTWTGCGTLAGVDGWLALAPSDVADLLLPEPEPDLAATPLHHALLGAFSSGGPFTGGAVFFRELADRAGRTLVEAGDSAPADDAVVAAIWDLVWAGMLTNDTLAPLRARLGGGRGGTGGGAHRPRRTAPRGRYAQLRAGRPAMPSRSGPPAVGGRWALVAEREPDPTRRAHARAEAFLERHGVLTRGALSTERVAGGFAGVYRVLRAMEDSGRCRRGYVVEGLGAAQFAVPGAIDRVRAMSRPDGPDARADDRFDAAPTWPSSSGGRADDGPSRVVLAAADPAQPYGAALPWPETLGDTAHRPGRKAGALVVLVDGAPVLYVERGGRSLLSFTAERAALRAGAEALAGAVHEGWLGSLAVERADGVGSLGSALAEVLTEAGFRVTPKGLRLRA